MNQNKNDLVMEDFVPYELAVKLEKKGFDWETRDVYERNPLACRYEDYPKPTISQVLKWLRKEKNLFVCIDVAHITISMKGNMAKYSFYITNLINHDRDSSFEKFDSPEPAAIAAIEYALNYLIEED